ncbi:MAG: hypothetical protein IKN45_00700 [Lachnospiraceae bacterium]|nr:hypothetical protein [Lachnospiraceae bacterium]
MLVFKCKNCGGEFEVNTHGELLCPFCHSKQYFTNEQLTGYDEFRDSLLKYLRSLNDAIAEEGDILNYWNYLSTRSFTHKDTGGQIEVSYTFQTTVDGVEVYINREHVIYHFSSADAFKAEAMIRNADSLSYPSADIKNLRQYLPALNARYELSDSSVLVSVAKAENVYPLFVFSNLHPKHVAWMISRMENLCCLFEFNGIDFKHMDEKNLFINPKTHEAFILGGWWDIQRSGGRTCLKELRKTAERITGSRLPEGPDMYRDFLRSEPKADAYEDFAYWDEVIMKGFGGHNFTKFDTE